MQYLGDFAEDASVYIPFNTFSSDDPQASVTATTLIASDIYVHKDGSVTDIVTDGATIAIDFDGVTGNHLITIDTSVHADYSTGSDYVVRIEGATVDGGNINAFVASFSIENRYQHGTAQTGDSYARLGAPAGASVSADIADVPTVSEFNARTLLAASYFDPATDAVATVTNLTNLPSIPNNWITAAGITASALDGKGDWNTTAPPTANAIADQVWDEAISGHAIVGSTGEALSNASSAGDPWGTALPGAYGAGTAGQIIGDNIDTVLSTLATAANLATVDTVVDTILVDTADLQANQGNWLTATGFSTSAALATAQADLDIITGVSGVNLSTATQASIDAIEADTNELQGDDIPTLIAALPTAAEINAEMVDVMEVDTHAQPASVPAATTTYQNMLSYAFTLGRNKMTQTATTTLLRNDADSATIGTSTVSDDGTTFTKGKFV